MVSHFLHKAEGDAAVVQLVHVQVEQAVIPLFHFYFQDRQLPVVAKNSQRISALLEERYVGRIDSLSSADESLTNDMDDCGFRMEVGHLQMSTVQWRRQLSVCSTRNRTIVLYCTLLLK
jgi:hypothetical protein